MTKERIKKEFIIKYFKCYYKKYNKIPISDDKEHPFSERTVYNIFGGWNQALIEANIYKLQDE